MSINMRGMSLSNACFKLFIIASLGFTSLFSKEFTLTVSAEREKIIEEIVITMGDTNLLFLKFKERHLRELSKQLRGMGSLNFLGYIFTHSELKDRMEPIRDSSFKWNGFMESVRKGFVREKEAGGLLDEIPSFARFLSVNEAALIRFTEQNDWDGFVSYLVDNVR